MGIDGYGKKNYIILRYRALSEKEEKEHSKLYNLSYDEYK